MAVTRSETTPIDPKGYRAHQLREKTVKWIDEDYALESAEIGHLDLAGTSDTTLHLDARRGGLGVFATFDEAAEAARSLSKGNRQDIAVMYYRDPYGLPGDPYDPDEKPYGLYGVRQHDAVDGRKLGSIVSHAKRNGVRGVAFEDNRMIEAIVDGNRVIRNAKAGN